MSRFDGRAEINVIMPLTFENHSSLEIESLLAEYPHIVASKLKDLDESRYNTIPKIVAERKAGGLSYLTKEEVVRLVEWKLSHGTFRPSLKKLVESNSEDDIRTASVNAFSRDLDSKENVKTAMDDLTKLKGIGPATASLLLSVCHPAKVPFFSDELYRWVFWEAGTGKGWDRSIKYTPKEYLEMFEKINAKYQEPAVDLEKAAYVAGKKAAGKSSEGQKAGVAGKEVEKPAVGDKKRKSKDTEDVAVPVPKKKTAPNSSKAATPGSRTSARLRSKT